MAYDATRQRVVLFGGDALGTMLGDLWEYNGQTWSARAASGPAPRTRAAMAFDAQRSRTVMFGGTTTSGMTNETWEWNGTTWVQGLSTTAPSGRVGHAMAFDGTRQRTILFGGSTTGIFDRLNDTWEWNGQSWQQLTTATTPPLRAEAGMAAPANGPVVLHGGNTLFPFQVLDDVWVLDGTDWRQIPAVGAPAGRYDHGFAFDAQRGEFVAFGGQTTTGYTNETWRLRNSQPATTTPFGIGCAGSNGIPTLSAGGTPRLGSNFAITATNLPTTPALAIGYFGFSRTSWGFFSLPLDLTAQGLPGCQMFVAPPPPGQIISTISSGGQCSWLYPVPNVPFLAGIELYFQALIPDAAAGNPTGATVTNALAMQIGL